MIGNESVFQTTPPENVAPASAKLFEYLSSVKTNLAQILCGRDAGDLKKDDLVKLMYDIAHEHEATVAYKLLKDLATYLAQPHWIARIGWMDFRYFNLDNRPPSPFAAVHAYAEAIYACKIRLWIIHPHATPEETPDYRLGRALCSAIFHSGVARKAVLEAFCRALSEPPMHLGGRGYYELSLPLRGVPEQEFRRLFLAPATELLVLNLTPEDREFSKGLLKKNGIWRAIKAFLYPQMESTNNMRSLGRAMRFAISSFQFAVPQMAVGYMLRRLVSHSLRTPVWLRIHGIQTPDLTTVFADDEDDDIDVIPRESFPKNHTAPDWYRDLRLALNANSSQEAIRQLELLHARIGSDVGTTAKAIVGYARHLYESKTWRGKNYSPKTIQGYLTRIYTDLVEFLPLDLPTQGWDDLVSAYGNALESIPTPGLLRESAQVIVSFHRYLADQYGAPPLVDADIIACSRMMAAVDANVISEHEFQKCLKNISNNVTRGAHPDVIEACILIAILLYRCGMRRSEAIGLTLDDMHLEGRAVVLIRNNRNRNLKTPNSKRGVPLYALLKPQELDRLVRWCNRRRREALPAANVFGSIPAGVEIFSEETVARFIHPALREATGDPSVHMHILRHSAGTHLAMALYTGAGNFDVIGEHRLFDSYGANPAEAASFRTQLLGMDVNTRKGAFAVTAILGHSSPSTTQLHYVHCLDLVAHAYLCQAFPVSEGDLRALSGLSRSWAYEAAQEGTAGLLAACRKRYGSRSPVPAPLPADQVSHGIQPGDPGSIPSLAQVNRILHLSMVRRQPPMDVASTVGVSPDLVVALLQGANEQFARYRTHEGKYSLPYIERAVDGGTGESQFLAIPAPHTHESAQSLSTDIYNAVLALDHMTATERRSLIELYLDNLWWTEGSVVFKSPDQSEDAASLLKFLRRLENQNLTFSLVSYSPKTRSAGRAAWSEKLGLSRTQRIEPVKTPSSCSDSRENWLGISADGEACGIKKSHAVRYAFLMAHIALGAAGL